MIFDPYLRWRHSRGFGIHSPFAYHIVTTAVTPGRRYSYYGYTPIDIALETTPRGAYSYRKIRKNARLLLRLIVALDAKRVIVPASAHPVFRVAAEAAGVKVENDTKDLLPAEGDLHLITTEEGEAFDKLKEAVAAKVSVMLTSPTPFDTNLINEILALEFEGVMLYGTHTALLLPRTHTAHARYSMLF